MRQEECWDTGWKFHLGDIPMERPVEKGPVYGQSKNQRKIIGPAAYQYADNSDVYLQEGGTIGTGRWETVTLPHDYVVCQDLDPRENNAHGYLHYENAWYRRHFSLPEGLRRDARITLLFEGVAGCATVYLNGALLAKNASAYNTFEVDISDNVYYDRDNVLAVYVDTQEYEGWWYQGGGIYRDVRLVITDPVAIDLWGVYAPARKLQDGLWQVDFETTVVNSSYADAAVRVESRILAADGSCVATATGEGSVALRERGVLRYSATVEHPHLWDTESPNLYTVETTLTADGDCTDCTRTRIGFRTVEISPERGLRLNGKQVFIHGLCSHQDFGLTGLAVPDNIARYKIALLKEMGANGYRTSHYMQSAATMDALDEMGFLVMDETRWFGSSEQDLRQLEALVRRDRNRPGVVFWSTSNEEPTHITDVGRRIHRAMAAQIRKLDATRFIVVAQDAKPTESTVYADCDVIGINYNLGDYDKVHAQYPDKAILGTECCATGTSRDWNFPSGGGRTRDYDDDTSRWFQGREKTHRTLHERPYVIGYYQWDAVEHRGEAVWPYICSRAGALDLFLQKKGAFYQNQSHWTDAPMAHIVPHWNFRGLEGREIPITVYTNCDELELFLNGRSLGRQSIARYARGQWTVPYAPGTLSVQGYRDGKKVAFDSRTTTGAPVKLRLTPDNEVRVGGRDLALFTCECLDEAGLPVPDAAETVQFYAAAPAKVIATGSDSTDPANVANPERRMYMGKIRVAVQPAAAQREIELFAFSSRCGAAACKLALSEPDEPDATK